MPRRPHLLILTRIDYFDTSGKLVESYLKRPIALKSFATVEVFIANTDVRAGTGANFVVDWGASGDIAPVRRSTAPVLGLSRNEWVIQPTSAAHQA